MAEFLPSDQCASAVAELELLEMADLEDVIALPAVGDLLSRLPSDRWAAVTSGSQPLMRARLAAAGLPVPDVLIAAEDVQLGKPDPQGYLDAAHRLGFDPRRCLVVEDAPAGLEAGRAAGAHVLGVATSHPAHDLSAAHVVIPDLSACVVEVTVEGLVISTAS